MRAPTPNDRDFRALFLHTPQAKQTVSKGIEKYTFNLNFLFSNPVSIFPGQPVANRLSSVFGLSISSLVFFAVCIALKYTILPHTSETSNKGQERW